MKPTFNIDQEEDELHKMASKKVEKLKAFYKQTFIYIVCLILFALREFTNLPLNFFPIQFINGIVMTLWSGVYIGCAIDLFVSFKIFGEKWEEQKVRSMIEKKTKKQKWE